MKLLKKFKWYWKYFNKPQEPERKEIPKGHLLMWEDDFRMRELLPKNNEIFLKKETQRIAEFAQEHQEENGFTSTTPIQKPKTELSTLEIQTSEIVSIMESCELKPVLKIWKQHAGTVDGINLPTAFGDINFAIIVNEESQIVNSIWFSGNINRTDQKDNITDAIYAVCYKYELAAVNWFSNQFSLCEDRGSTQKFVENCI